MPAWFLVLFGLALMLIGTALFVAAFVLWAYSEKRAYLEPRTILCPENLEYATVTVDAARAAKTMLSGRQQLRITSCTRWPEMAGCDEACAVQVSLVGDDRAHGKYAPFGSTPEQLSDSNPVRMTPDMFGKISARDAERYRKNRSA
jgi:hypothetical protein